MKKIMFSDKFSLTKAVLDGRKTQTRRMLTLTLQKKGDMGKLIDVFPTNVFFEDGKWKFTYDDYDFLLPKMNYPKYNIGEVVAVAQSYKNVYNEHGLETMDMLVQHLKNSAGWHNKLFIRADLMTHQIRITNVRIERLKDISDEDCLKEGIQKMPIGCEYLYSFYDNDKGVWNNYKTPRKAFANLINKMSRKDVWNENPYVFVYDFEMVKGDAK